MERIRREASRILALYKVHSEHTWPRRLVFKNPNLESGKSAVFQHLYAGAYHTPATVEVWLSENTTQGDLGRLSATRDFGMGETPLASLRVVVLHGEGGKRHILHVDRTVFFELFSTLALDEYALYLYLTNVPGLHFLGRKTPKADDGSPVFDFYLNAIDYTFIWSYDQGTQATNVILIGEADAKWETNQLLDAMCVKDHIIFNPLYLAFLACSRGFLDTWECDVEFIPTQNVVRRKTMELDLDAAADLSQFSEAGLGFGKSLNSSVRSLRILRVLQSIANQLDPAHADSLWNQALGITGVAGQRDDGGKDDTVCQSASQIQTAMLFLQRQLTSRVGHFEGQIRWSKVNMQLVSRYMYPSEPGPRAWCL